MYKQHNVEVLISAMFQKDLSIIDSTNISTDAILINQCDYDSKTELQREFGIIRCISTTERGLSNSRNMAIMNARGEICLIADDDEKLDDDYANIIISAYNRYPKADIICFIVRNDKKKYSNKVLRVGFIRALHISSWQMTFKRERIIKKGLKFNSRFGSGTPNGSGEENIFLYECLKKGLKVYYIPVDIGEVENKKNSRWFHGFNEEYFDNRGKIIRELMGPVVGIIYCSYFIISKHRIYRNSISIINATKNIFHGLWSRNT